MLNKCFNELYCVRYYEKENTGVQNICTSTDSENTADCLNDQCWNFQEKMRQTSIYEKKIENFIIVSHNVELEKI